MKKTIHPRKQSGSSLVVVISVLATLMVIVGVAAEYTHTVNRHVQRSNTLQSAVAVADSCIDMIFANWRKICSNPPNQTQTLPTTSFLAIALPTSSEFLNIPGFGATAIDYYGTNLPNPPTISNYKVVAADAEWQPMALPNETPIPMIGQIAETRNSLDPTLDPKIKTTTLIYNYIASADVTLPALGPTGTVVAKVRRVFQKQQISPWNFAIFYVDPLEMHPGPLQTVTGWVHTNSDLFTGHNTLTFADRVTYGSDWFVDFKPGETYHDADTPTSPNYPANLPPSRSQAMQPFGLDSTAIFNTTDPNPNNDSYRELIEPPTSGFADPLAEARYYNQASIIITVASNGSYIIGQGNGNGTYTTLHPPASGPDLRTQAQKNLFNMFNGAITTGPTTTIQDNREARGVRLVTLDISALQNTSSPNTTNKPAWKATPTDGFNGIVYIHDNSATSSVRRGVRLRNGRSIPLSGLTVASANPVYIQGDFNTGPGTVPSNSTSSNDPTTPQSAGYNRPASEATLTGIRAPASVVADAVNILSSNWNDSNAESGDPLSARVATNTTVNAAIVAGIVPSSPVGGNGSYSGGAENFPRFLEGWDNKKFTYYGSMVQLYNSKQAIGEWTMANVYDAPDRQWYFDGNFRMNPPPGSLMIYSYIKGKWSVL